MSGGKASGMVNRGNELGDREQQHFRVVVVVCSDFRAGDGFTARVSQMAEALAAQGHNVRGLWCAPLLSVLRGRRPTAAGHLQWSVLPMLPACRLKLFRLFSETVTAFLVWLWCVLHRIDVVQAEEPRAARLALMSLRPVIMDVHGDAISETELGIRLGRYEAWAGEYAAVEERVAVKRASGLICVSHALRTLLERRYGRLPKTGILPCLVDISRFTTARHRRGEHRRQHGWEDRFVVCYLGGLSAWQNVPAMIDLVATLRRYRPSVVLLLITQDDVRPLQKYLSAVGEEGIAYSCISALPTEVPGLLSMADLGCLLRSNSTINAVASPTKCGEYLAAGVPVLTTQHAGDAAAIVAAQGVGLVLGDTTPTADELASLVSMIDHVERHRALWCEKCHAAAEAYRSTKTTRAAVSLTYAHLQKTTA